MTIEYDFDFFDKRLSLDASTGLLVWKSRTPEMFETDSARPESVAKRWNSRFAGKAAFSTMRPDGYLCGGIGDKTFLTHRVVWLLSSGEWPRNFVDHINGDKSDNRMENLREATPQESLANRSGFAGAASENLGVTRTETGAFTAKITVDGEPRYLGTFLDEESAAIAYECAAITFFGEFARTKIIQNPHNNRRKPGRPRTLF